MDEGRLFSNGWENCTRPDKNQTQIGHYLNITTEFPIEYAIPLYGYIMPFLCIVTLVANTLVVVVLSKRHMRTPTNSVLLAMALADMFTVLFSAPWHFYMYTFGNHYKPFYPLSACYAWSMMNEVIPNLFHTASIWLTLALAVQRYIYVCHAPVARTWCTMPRVLKGIAWIFVFAALHQSTRFVDRIYAPCNILWEGHHYLVCKPDLAYWVEFVLTPDVYFNIYYWFRVFFVHTIPCVALILLNVLLFKALREAQRKRDLLFKDNKKSNECKKMRDSNCTTMMLIVVVSVFLIVEVPLAVVTVLHIISSTVSEFLDYKFANVFILFSNFIIIITYPINFAIYCGMSRQFRETFKEMFVKGGTGRRDGSNRYSIVNGPRTLATNETVL